MHEFLQDFSDFGIEKAGATHGLKREESLAIFAYSMGMRDRHSPFRKVNSYLRTGTPDNSLVRSLAEDVTDSIARLPLFRGLTYRRTDLPSRVRRSVTKGVIFSDPAFFSTSSDLNTFDGNDVMLISGRSGANISNLSAFPGESEVLFAPNTSFLIGRVEGLPNGVYLEMREA